MPLRMSAFFRSAKVTLNQESKPGIAGASARGTTLEVRVADLNQLFNSMDPSPFREKDLDPRAEQFIINLAKDLPGSSPLTLLVHSDRGAINPRDADALREAVRVFFTERAAIEHRSLRELLRRGRISLLIGILFLGVMLILGDIVSHLLGERRIGELLQESLLIGGWVAMWRPLEILLYDWWPVRANVRLFERLSAMSVQIANA